MGPGLGADRALEALLDVVVADHLGRAKASVMSLPGDLGDQRLALVGVGAVACRAQHRVAVGLQFEPDRVEVGPDPGWTCCI